MMDDTNGEPKTGNYPYGSLEEALILARAVKELGGHGSEVAKSLLAQQLKAEEDSASFKQRLGTAKAYGILTGRAGYMLTSAGRKYFFPQTDTEADEALLEFFMSPTAFKHVVAKFDGNILPKTDMLGNVLVASKLVPQSWGVRVAQIFMRSGQFARVIDDSGILRVSGSLARIRAKVAQPGVSITESLPRVAAPPLFPAPIEETVEPLAAPGEETYRFMGVTLRIPEKLSPEAWKRMKKIIDAVKPDGVEDN